MQFYEEVVGDRVIDSYDDYVHFSGGYALEKCEEPFDGSHTSLHFEEEDLGGFMKYLESIGVDYVLDEMPNCQRWIVLKDPDNHTVEVVEHIEETIKRLLSLGMTVEEVSEKSWYPIEYVKRFAK